MFKESISAENLENSDSREIKKDQSAISKLQEVVENPVEDVEAKKEFINKTKDKLKKIGINPRLDESKVAFYKNNKTTSDGNKIAGGYNPFYGETRVYGLGSDEKENITTLMHEGLHKSVRESFFTSKERKEMDRAKYILCLKRIKKLEEKRNKISREANYHTSNSEEVGAQLDEIRNEISQNKKHLEFYEKRRIGILKNVLGEKAEDYLYKQDERCDDSVDEAFAQFLDEMTLNYDPETEKFDRVYLLEGGSVLEEYAEETFGKDEYNSERDKKVYLSLIKFYRKLFEEIKNMEEVFQIIMPFSKYVKDESEIEDITSSETTFNEFMEIVKNTEDKRDVARKWMRVKAVKSASTMFENKEKDSASFVVKKTIIQTLKKLFNFLKH